MPVVEADSASTEVNGRAAPGAAWAAGEVAVSSPAARATVTITGMTAGMTAGMATGMPLTDLRMC